MNLCYINILNWIDRLIKGYVQESLCVWILCSLVYGFINTEFYDMTMKWNPNIQEWKIELQMLQPRSLDQ